MKITLSQSDIVEALHRHIAAQGINLVGKSVDIKFTMKKLGAGVEADVSIDAIPQLPDLSDDTTTTRAPALVVVADNSTKVAVVAEPVAEEVPAAAEVATETEEPAAEAPEEPVAEPAAKTTSLFN